MARRARRPVARQGRDGYWHTWVTVGTKANGKSDRRHISRPTCAEAEAEADELLDTVAKAGAAAKAGKKPTVEGWLTTYLDTIAPRRCNPGTVYDYRSKMRNWVWPEYGHLRLDRLTPEHLDAIYLAMSRAGKAPSHQLKVHRILSRALDIAVRRGLVARNVCKLVDAPSVDEARVEALAERYALQILEVARGRRNTVRWSVAFALGLRQGEALGLRWEVGGQDLVDLDAGVIHIWWQLRRRIYEHGCGGSCGKKRGADCPRRSGGGLQFVKTKGKSKRSIPIPPQLLPAFKAHRRDQRKERLAWPGKWGEHGVVFAGPGGALIDPRDDYDEWVSILAEAGVPHSKLHIMRHTSATMLLAQGVDIRTVQKIMGHRDIRTTSGYTQAADELMTDAVSKIGGRLFGTAGS